VLVVSLSPSLVAAWGWGRAFHQVKGYKGKDQKADKALSASGNGRDACWSGEESANQTK